MEPVTLKSIFKIPKKNDVSKRKKLSIANVEYVVKAPKKPVLIKALVVGWNVWTAKKANNEPIKKEPRTFTPNTPKGKSLTNVLFDKWTT